MPVKAKKIVLLPLCLIMGALLAGPAPVLAIGTGGQGVVATSSDQARNGGNVPSPGSYSGPEQFKLNDTFGPGGVTQRSLTWSGSLALGTFNANCGKGSKFEMLNPCPNSVKNNGLNDLGNQTAWCNPGIFVGPPHCVADPLAQTLDPNYGNDNGGHGPVSSSGTMNASGNLFAQSPGGMFDGSGPNNSADPGPRRVLRA